MDLRQLKSVLWKSLLKTVVHLDQYPLCVLVYSVSEDNSPSNPSMKAIPSLQQPASATTATPPRSARFRSSPKGPRTAVFCVTGTDDNIVHATTYTFLLSSIIPTSNASSS